MAEGFISIKDNSLFISMEMMALICSLVLLTQKDDAVK